ncbi:hypothetical protein [Bradyrhizobium sp. 40]|nr:hypothetical protein [Bradyrhizobium sp. 40]
MTEDNLAYGMLFLGLLLGFGLGRAFTFWRMSSKKWGCWPRFAS